MKTIKHIIPLLLVIVLMLGLFPLGVFASGDEIIPTEQSGEEITEAPSSGEPEGEVTTEATPTPETATPTPAETAAPTATPAPAPTVEPSEVPTEAPAPTEVPEIAPPIEEGPSIDEPYGDGIVMGPNNPPEGSVALFSTISGTASIAVHNCYDSYGSQIKYVSSFYYNSKYIGGNGSPRYQITANGSPAYCIEPGGYLPGGSTVSTSTAHIWNGFSSDKRDAIKVALLCGEPGNSSNLSGNFGSRYTATQLIVWELIVGARSTYSPYNCTDSKVINSVCSGGANSEVKTVYDQISNAMRTYSILPSFVSSLYAPAPTSEMTYQNGAFTITLTDSNGVLSNYNFTSNNGSLRFSTSGNRLTITSSSPVNSATVNVTKKNAVSVSSTITAYAGSGLQETIVGVEASDNTSGWFCVNAEGEAPPPAAKASIEIIKTSDDGYISGIMFTVTGEGRNLMGPTDSTGHVRALDLEPGTYTVTETVPSGYVADKNPQTVTVSSGEAATVYFHNSLKKGTIQIVKTSDDGVVSGIKFTLSGPNGTQTVTTGSNGKISVPNLTPGTYTVTEQVPAGYTADQTSQRFTLMPGELYTVTFHNTPQKGGLKIVKTSEDGVVSGIKFDLSGEGIKRTYTTGPTGVLNIQNLAAGTYTVTEQVPAGYSTSKASQTVTVKTGEVAEVDFYNSIQKGNLKIVKTSSDGIVSGIKFRIVGTGYDKTYPTDSKGVLNVVGLTPGTYTITEQVPAGYQADNPSQTVTVKAGEKTEVTFHNTLQKGSLKVIKTSDDGVVSGIKFRITGTGYDKTYPTDAKGVLNVVGITPGTYTVTEQVPEGYAADNPSQTVTIKGGALTTVNFHNTRKVGGIKIIKDSDDGVVGNIQFTVAGEGTSNTVTTEADGTINVPGLVPGEYTVTELVPGGYVSDNPSQKVTVRADDCVSVFFTNKLKQWRVAVTKVDAEANVRRSSRATLEGAQYGVYHDGTLQDTYETDEHGQFVTEYYPCGTGWTLQEVSAPTGYTVDPTSYTIGLEPGTTQLAANDTELTVPEEIIKGKLVLVKQDAGVHTPLAGAVFTVYDESGATVTEATTGEDGTATVEELPYGKYTAKETTAPDGYLLDDSVIDFSIETDGQEVRLTRDNYPAIGSITVYKKDSQGGYLSGASYLLEWSVDGGPWQPVTFRDSTTATAGGCTSLGLESGQLTTGADGVVKFDGLLADGKVQYRLTESKAPVGMSLLKDPAYTGPLPVDGGSDDIYDITITVTDNRITGLPMTGSHGFWTVTLGMFLAGLSGCAVIFYTKKRRSN